MALQSGIVGLPNVGKSTLFNALSGASAAAANYPFCTIAPNRGIVPVPDDRLDRLAACVPAVGKVPATVAFVDIAGLVAGASRGEGLGNAFLGHIREVEAIVHVVRCFESDEVAHVEGRVDPARDIDTVTLELLLKDLETVGKQKEKAAKNAKSGDKLAASREAFCERVQEHLNAGHPARRMPGLSEAEEDWLRGMFLLTDRPVLYVANVSEAELPRGNKHADIVQRVAAEEGASCLLISAEFEAQIREFPPDERSEFLQSVGMKASGLSRLIRATYDLLGLITFFSHGPKETRAWTVTKGTKAPQAGGQIHSDFERGFIRAETINVDEFIRLGSESVARAAGAMRSEGKEYVVQDGDVILFRFNV